MGISLVTKAEYKAYAGINTTTEDTLIDILVVKVSALVKTFCRRSFVDYVNDAKSEYFDGGLKTLVPDEYPILSVSSLEYSADYGNSYTSLVEYTDYVLKRSDNTISAIAEEFPLSINGYKLTYTAGYETLPEDLKLAIFDLISYYLKNDMAVHSNKAPGTNTVQIEYVTNTNLPSHIKRVLDQYTANYN